jgi:hypothetical protein
MVESFNSLAYVLAPVLAGLLYDWRPIAIFPASLAVLLLTLIISAYFVYRNGYQKGEIIADHPVKEEK